jgi:transcriptional regulator with XRE-family HTH domain
MRILRRALAIRDNVPPEMMTQARMAKAAGVSVNAWNNYERQAGARIGNNSARALKRVTGVSLDWLYDGELDSIHDPALREALLRAEMDLYREELAEAKALKRA